MSRKYFSGSTSPTARRKAGERGGGPDERDREARERGVRAAVRHHSRKERLRCGLAVDLAAVHRAEQHEQEQREQEDEECCFPASPELELLVAQLVEEEPHSTSSAVS